MREQRSLLNFAILIVVSAATAVFVLNNARKAIAEIDALSSKPVYVAQRQLTAADDKKIDTSDWKTYRNDKYGFEVKYPKKWFLRDITFDPNDERKIADFIIMFDSQEIQRAREALHLPSRGLKIIITDSFTESETQCPSGGTLLAIESIVMGGDQSQRCKTEFGQSSYSIPIVHNRLLYKFSYPAESIDTSKIDQVLATLNFIR